MAGKLKWLGISALMVLAAGSAVQLTGTGFGQSEARSTAALSVPYSTEANGKIAGLRSAPSTPKNVDDLRAIQERVEAVYRQVLPAVVAVRIRTMSENGFEREEGSGVIVSKDGYVLTAGHVSGDPGTEIEVILSNGRSVWGKALGANNLVDSGMIKIDNKTYQAEYPYVPLGDSSSLRTGQWVVALGHPGGYQPSRPPVMRIGRVLQNLLPGGYGRVPQIRTDCELIMGDSGGPVFDLDGRLVAINSRIGIETTSNIHVPIDTFTRDWDRLAKGEEWGSRTGPFFARGGMGRDSSPAPPAIASLGLRMLNDPNGPLVIQTVRYGQAAEKAGLKVNDIITKFAGTVVKTQDDLVSLLSKHKPGDTVAVEIKRDGEVKTINVKLEAAQP